MRLPIRVAALDPRLRVYLVSVLRPRRLLLPRGACDTSWSVRSTPTSVPATGCSRRGPERAGGSADGAQTIAPMSRRTSAARPVAATEMNAATA